MRRRWRLWLGLAVLLAVGRVCVHPVGYWPIYGWIRGDAFYRGKPSSYWREVIQAQQAFRGPPRPLDWVDQLEESTGLDLERKWMLRPDSHPFDDVEDPEAVLVLVDLLEYSDLMHQTARSYGVRRLQQLGPKAAAAVPRLLKLAVVEEDMLAYRIFELLETVDPEAAVRAMELRQAAGLPKKPKFQGTLKERATLPSTESSAPAAPSR